MSGIYLEVLEPARDVIAGFNSQLCGWEYEQGEGGENGSLQVQSEGVVAPLPRC